MIRLSPLYIAGTVIHYLIWSSHQPFEIRLNTPIAQIWELRPKEVNQLAQKWHKGRQEMGALNVPVCLQNSHSPSDPLSPGVFFS